MIIIGCANAACDVRAAEITLNVSDKSPKELGATTTATIR